MMYALCLSLYVALILAAVVRAAQPGELLAPTVGRAWKWWLIFRPLWLPEKLSGGCTYCVAFWFVGVPVAVLAAVFGEAGWWAVGMPWMIGFATEKLTT